MVWQQIHHIIWLIALSKWHRYKEGECPLIRVHWTRPWSPNMYSMKNHQFIPAHRVFRIITCMRSACSFDKMALIDHARSDQFIYGMIFFGWFSPTEVQFLGHMESFWSRVWCSPQITLKLPHNMSADGWLGSTSITAIIKETKSLVSSRGLHITPRQGQDTDCPSIWSTILSMFRCMLDLAEATAEYHQWPCFTNV